MMYARIELDQIVEYPLYEVDIQRRFPELDYPLNSESTLPESYVRVTPNPIGVQDYSLKYSEGLPLLILSEYVQSWVTTPLSPEELTAQEPEVAAQVRNRRNSLLLQSDIWVVADRWAGYSEAQRTLYADYRQALRDISAQPGFPYSVTWPTSPW